MRRLREVGVADQGRTRQSSKRALLEGVSRDHAPEPRHLHVQELQQGGRDVGQRCGDTAVLFARLLGRGLER